MGAPWRTCPGRSIVCASSCACANGFAAIAPVTAASSPNGCPRWRPPGRGAPCGSPSAWSPLAWRSAGKAGVRLGHAWDLAVSRNTLLRLLRRQPAPSFPTPTGARGGRFRPAQTPHVWHDAHRSGAPPARGPAPGSHGRHRGAVAPGAPRGGGDRTGSVERLCRGRAPGRAAATQVADRFHLLQNLREALDQVFTHA